MVDIASIAIKADTRDLKKARTEMDRVGQTGRQTERKVRRATDGMKSGFMSVKNTIGLVGAAMAGLGVARFISSVTRATVRQEQAVAQLRQGIESTNQAAGRSIDQLIKKAGELQKATTFGDEEIIESMSQLVTFVNITGEEFDRTTQAVLDLSTRMDQDLRSSVVQLGKALNDPVSNLGALSRTGIQFSDSQKELIKDLANTNRLAEAQGVILEELEQQFGGSAEAAKDTLGGALAGLSNTFGDLLEGDAGGGGVNGAIQSINDLTETLNDPNVERGFQAIVQGIFSVTSAIADGIGWIGRYMDEIQSVTTRALIILEEVDKATSSQDNPWFVDVWQRSPMGWGGAIGQMLVGNEGPQGLASGLKEALSELDRQEHEDALANVNKELDALIDNSELFGSSIETAGGTATEAMDSTTESAEKAGEALEEISDKTQKILDDLFPHKARVRELTEEYRLLKAEAPEALGAWLDANIKVDTATRELAETVRDDATGSVQELGEEVNHLGNIWENTTRNIQSAMSDMFFDILDQGKVTFDGILDAFKRMAAEMMAQEIMLRFTGQGGGPISNLFSNVMGGGSGGGGLDFGSLASAGGSMWSGVQGLLGGEGLSGFSGMGAELASGLGFGGGGLDSLMVNAGTRSTTLGAGGGISGGGGGGFGSNLMSSAGSMWPIAVIAGMLQSGKLYDQGVRPDPDETFSSTQGNIIGQMGNVGPTLQSGVFESLDSILEPIVGGKGAAMLTGSTFHQELWNSINEGIFGSDYQATRGGIKLGMGTHNDFNPTAWTRESKKGGLFSSSSRRYKHSELDDDLREPLVDTYESTLDRVQAMYETIGIDVGEGVLRAVETADMLVGTAGKSEQTEEEIKKQIHEWFTQLSDDMSKAVVDGMSMENLTELAGAIAPLRRMMATSPVERARSDYDAGQSTTLRSTYSDATDQVRRLADAYDGSVQSSRQLSSALQQQQETAYQLAMAYQQTSASVESLFGNLHEQIRTSLMSQEELYNYQRRQVHTLTDMLADMTDPERIMQTSERIENLVSSMWQPLNEEQRQKKGPQFLEYLEEVEQVAQERLQVGMDKIESNQTDINESIRQGINNAATVMQQAAQGQQEAANRNIEAANMMGMSAEQIAAAVANMQRNGGMEANG